MQLIQFYNNIISKLRFLLLLLYGILFQLFLINHLFTLIMPDQLFSFTWKHHLPNKVVGEDFTTRLSYPVSEFGRKLTQICSANEQSQSELLRNVC